MNELFIALAGYDPDSVLSDERPFIDRGEDFGPDVDPAWCWWCMEAIIPNADNRCPECRRPASDLPDREKYPYDLAPLTGWDPYEEARP